MIEKSLIKLYEEWAGEKVIKIQALPASGSYRRYFRIESENKKCLGVFNNDIKENEAFIEFSKHFLTLGLKIPQIFTENKNEKNYLIEDFGDETLFSKLQKIRTKNSSKDEIIAIYKKVITELPKFQIIASKELNYDLCYPRKHFDKQSMLWDLNYFKYYFLKLAQISFDEQALEEDFHTFTNFLLETETNYFLYRDFQSRNIMFYEGIPCFIDYQGGRKGALQYDIASLLYDAKANLSNEIREELLNFYLIELEEYIEIDKAEFKSYYYGYVIIRILQAMGAYGFRGFYENKAHFLQSIPYAVENLNYLLINYKLPIKLNTLLNVLLKLSESKKIKQIINTQKLNININSFSYKKQLPQDNSGNGGGFVFDCRALPNPGRLEAFKSLTGKDKEVINFLEREDVISQFIENIMKVISISIDNYIERGFEHLMINFGCTGGQHRSVYCAEKISKLIEEKFNIHCQISHIEQDSCNNN